MIRQKQLIRPMTEKDLCLVLAWRNHSEVRRFMYTSHEISEKEHHAWFERSLHDSRRHLLIFEDDQRPLGFINIYELGLGGIADWGFFAAPDAPKGTGQSLGIATLRYAFADSRLHKLCGQVLSFNERSIRFHKALGFRQEGVLRCQHFDGRDYQDVFCFGLLADEWQAQP